MYRLCSISLICHAVDNQLMSMMSTTAAELLQVEWLYWNLVIEKPLVNEINIKTHSKNKITIYSTLLHSKIIQTKVTKKHTGEANYDVSFAVLHYTCEALLCDL